MQSTEGKVIFHVLLVTFNNHIIIIAIKRHNPTDIEQHSTEKFHLRNDLIKFV
jgi:hypothetical protein